MTEQDTMQAPTENGSAGLGSLKLTQLRDLATQLGITGTSRMRKAQLVEVITDHQRGGSSTERPAAKEAKVADDKPQKAKAAEDKPQKSRTTARAKKAATKPADTAAAAEQTQTASESTKDQQSEKQAQEQLDIQHDGDAEKPDAASEEPKQREQQSGRGRRGGRSQQSRDDKAARDESTTKNEPTTKTDDAAQQEDEKSEEQESSGRGRGQRTRNQQRRDQDRQRRDSRDDQDSSDDQDSDESGDDKQDGSRRRRDDDQRNQRRQRQRDRNRSRDRRRDQDQDHDSDDDQQHHEVSEDESLVPISGILDVLDNYAFVRTSGYLPGPNDVYVSMAMVKRYGLRKGDAVRGQVRAPGEDDDGSNQGGGRGRGGRGGRNRRSGGGGGGGNRQKFNALVKLDWVNGQEAVEHPKRVEFNKLTPLYPKERLRLEDNNPKDMGPRLVDLVAPIGKGQRGLIVSPPKAGKTMMLQSIANAITTNNPEVKLMMVLVDERPEEVTDMQRSVRGEVIASTFDRPAEDHTTVAELSIERAKRMVELGHDVVVLLDSMTRLGRAYNLTAPASGRILSGGVDSAALYPPKKFFGAARNIEGGGSLTILATALVETGSRMDEVIFEEFKGTGNMELRLSRDLSERRIFPAIDINASGTRREENLLTAEEIRIMWRLRRVLSGLETQQALELLTSKLKETETNAEFLMLVSKTTLRGQAES